MSLFGLLALASEYKIGQSFFTFASLACQRLKTQSMAGRFAVLWRPKVTKRKSKKEI